MARDLTRHLDAELRGAVQAASRLVRDEARRNHGYVDRSGALTRSIVLLPLMGIATDGTLEGGVVAQMHYASYVEEGTERARAFHYLGVAFLLHRSDILRLWDDAAENAVFRTGLGR